MKTLLLPLCLALSALAADGLDMLKPGLDVGILVSETVKSKEFYGETLGLRHIGTLDMPNGGKMMRFQSGASVLKVIAYEKVPPKNPTGIREAVGFRLVTLLVTDGEGVAKRIAAKGGADLQWTAVNKIRYAFAPDPDGNIIEIVDVAPETGAKAIERVSIGLTVADSEKSRAFYSKVLGLTELPAEKLQTGVMKYSFAAGSSIIKFWQSAPNTPVKTGGPQDALGLRYFTFMVKDADAAQTWLTVRGAKVMMPPTDFGRLARILFIADPDGNFIEFAAPPKPAAAK